MKNNKTPSENQSNINSTNENTFVETIDIINKYFEAEPSPETYLIKDGIKIIL